MCISSEEELLKVARDLLEFRNFRDIKVYEGTGADGGRDLEAITSGRDDADCDYAWKWWIELKFRAKGNLAIGDIPDKIRRAGEQRIDFFLLITNAPVSAVNQKRFHGIAEEWHLKFRMWDKHKLQDLIRIKEISKDRREVATVPIRDRFEEIAMLEGLMKAGDHDVVFIRGAGGVGKSALSRHLMYRHYQQYACGLVDSRLNHDFGFSLKMLAGSFERQGCNTRFAYSSGQRLLESERLELFLEHCCEMRTLLLIDNFEEVMGGRGEVADRLTARLIDHFLHHNMRGSVLLITSRVALADVRITGHERFVSVPLKGWNIQFVLDEYLPSAQFLNTKLGYLQDDVKKKREMLEVFKGNPLALKIANQLCADYEFREMVSLLPQGDDPAHALVAAFSEELDPVQKGALSRFAQFDRPMTAREIGTYVCDEDTLNRLTMMQLIEPASSDKGQYQLHAITAERFSLSGDPPRRKALVLPLAERIRDQVGRSKNGMDDSYNHFLLRQAVRMLIEVGEFEEAGAILSNIGTRAVSMGDIEYLTRTLERIEPHLSAQLLGRLKKVHGHIEDLRGDFDRSHAVYSEMLEMGERLDDPWIRSAALNGLGTMARHKGELERAISIYHESLTIREATDDLVGQSNSHHNIGASYLELHQIERARSHLQRALDLRKRLGDRFRMSASQLYLAECHCLSGDYDRAREEIRTCIRNKLVFDDLVGILWARLLMVKIDLLEPVRDDEQLEENLAWCLDNSAKLNKGRDIMLSHAFAGVHALLTSSNDSRAWNHLSEARTMAKFLNPVQFEHIRQLLRCMIDLDDTEQLAVQALGLVRSLKV